jgi:AcrR family transcriptional regulator
LDLVSRGETLSSISLVAVAQTAGVSRNSIYRRWKSKEQLYSDVVTSMKRELPEPTELSARENLIALMDVRSEEGDGRYIRRMEQAIVAEAEIFADLYLQFSHDVTEPFESAMKVAIRRGKETGEIRPDIDEILLCAVLASAASAGPRSIDSGSLDTASRRVIDLIFDGVAPL